MQASIIGPTNIEKLSRVIGRDLNEIQNNSKKVGETLAKLGLGLNVVFNYEGMLKEVGNSLRGNQGELTMLYTENDYDWDVDYCIHQIKTHIGPLKKFDSWHDMLLYLIRSPDLVICCGISSGVLAEIGYMKWDAQENKGNVKKIIAIKEFLRNEEMFPEIMADFLDKIEVVSIVDLEKTIKKYI